ncbi:MAG TPA: Asp-tRNA(Asn)/Glu-tRNA(Gln) amidotransferase subunit GatA [Clostridiaceae bacterium]|nr:Asp-tRNA(Asn)/Glu-tRNA(Gln) amidotransferase subunit GatA [Clostridiaceae bacterium]
MSLEFMSAEDIRKGIEEKRFSAEEIAVKFIENIKTKDNEINAFLLLCEEKAIEQAKLIDKKKSKGEPLGKLAGVPVAIKDNICTDGIRTTCASRMLEDFIPPYNATVVDKLINEDAIIIGKTNMDEFAMGSSTENSAFKITKNPRDLTRVPGGSSGGSAAAVAGDMVPVSLGSDTGGSIRQPAAFCGVVGLKPTYGLVSRYGLIAFGSSLDQIGPFSKTVRDSALVLEVIQGRDKRDSTSYDGDYETDYLLNIDAGIKGMRIGVPKEFFSEGLDKEIDASIRDSIEILKSCGALVEETSIPIVDEGLSAYYIISSAEASSNLARYDGIRYGHRTKDYENVEELIEKSRSEAFGAEVKRRIMLGTYALSSGYYDEYYKRAQKFRKVLREQFEESFKKFDIVIGPTSPVLPFKIGEKKSNPLEMYLADVYTVNINLAGLPAVSLPCGLSHEKLPIGLQLIGPRFGEKKILQAAYTLERELQLEL